MANELNINITFGVTKAPFTKPLQKTVRASQSAIGNVGGTPTIAFESGKVGLGRNIKPSAKASTTTALPANTYANGTAGVGATLTATGNGALAAQDGVTLALNDYLVVKNEASSLKNGMYKLTTVGDGSNPYVLTRQIAMDANGKYVAASVYVEGGSTLSGTWWCCTNASEPTVGTTAVTFAQAASGTVISPGSITVPGFLFVQNMDATNFVQIGPEVGGVMMPALRVKSGEIGLIRLDYGQVLRALADTANVQLYYEMYQD